MTFAIYVPHSEEFSLARLGALGYDCINAEDIAPVEPAAKLTSTTRSAADPLEWQEHIRSETRFEKLADRFRDLHDRLKLVIVRDVWLTGFSTVPVLRDAVLTKLACELTQTIRNSVTLDSTVNKTVPAKPRTVVRRWLKKHGYPPDKTEKAVETVLGQAELLAADWAGV